MTTHINTMLLALMLGLSPSIAQSQASDTLNNRRLRTVIITGALSYSVTMIGLNSIWYSQHGKQSFRFFNDGPEWKQMDKAGHAFSAFHVASIGTHALQWSGVSKNKSDKASAITSFAILSSIEILDGFSSGYGASASDWAANALGSGFFLGQQLLWNEVRIHPKYSFHRTGFAKQRPNILGDGLIEEMIKDYNGQTYWLSADMDKFLKFPKWLNLAVGYGAENMIYARDIQNNQLGYRQLYVALDFDLTAIKSRSKVVNTLLFFANMLKLPAPTIELAQGRARARFYYY